MIDLRKRRAQLNLSRRGFLQGSALVGLTAASGSLLMGPARAQELRYRYVSTAEELAAAPSRGRLLGLFANQEMFEHVGPAAPLYEPSVPLRDMADKALNILSRDRDGFFLVIEEEGIDALYTDPALAGAPGLMETAGDWLLAQRLPSPWPGLAWYGAAFVALAGAAALIVVLPASATAADIEQGATGAERASRGVPTMPVFYVARDAARSLFQSANLDFNALTGAGAAPPVPLAGVTAQLGGGIAEVEHRPPNVVGMLRGSDPELRDTYVVFSAHIDHTGICAPGTADPICNGADDDASGTSAIMELAEAFAKLPTAPRRSLIFLGVSGEEKGLLGSSYYADNPTVPIESVVANINIDMIGRNNPDSVVVIGKDYSTLGPLLEQVNSRHPELRMTTSDDIWPEQRFFFRSDHFNFARREVPAIFFFTGVHEDYHRPSDTVDKIDLDKITRITRLIFHYGNAIANADETPQWDPAGLEEVRRLVSQRR